MMNRKSLVIRIGLLFLLTTSAAFAADSDHDGLSDALEDSVIFDPTDLFDPENADDVLGDSDENGFSAWAEYLDGSSSPTAGTDAWTHQSLDDVNGYPVKGADGELYVISRDRTLYALNPDGSTLWTYGFDAYVEHAPAITADGSIYVATGVDSTSGDINLVALNSDGTLQWTYAADDLISAPPVVADNGNIYIITRDRRLVAIDAAGNEQWVFEGDSLITHAPAVDADGSLLVVTKDKMWRITVQGIAVWVHFFDGEIAGTPAVAGLGTAYVPIKERAVVAVDSFNNEIWTFSTDGYVTGSPAISAEGDIIVGDRDGKVYSIDIEGNENWRFQANDAISTAMTVGRDGHVYFGAISRTLYSLDKNGIQRWTYSTGGYITSTPMLTNNGVVYTVDRDGKLYALLDNTIGHSPWAGEHKNLRGNSHQCWSPYGYLYYNVDSDEDGTNDCEEFQLGIMDLPQPPSGIPEGNVSAAQDPCYITTGQSSCSSDISWSTSEVVFARLWRQDGAVWSQTGSEGESGVYTANGITESGMNFELHNSVNHDDFLASKTVYGASGDITVTPRVCEIPPGQPNCTISVSWTTTNLTQASLWSSTNNGPWMQEQVGTSGSFNRVVDSNRVRFELHVGAAQGIELDAVNTSGVHPAGQLSVNPDSCEIPSGQSTCTSYATWSANNASVNGASLWRQDGTGGWTSISSSRWGTNSAITGVTVDGVNLELYWGPNRSGEPLATASISAIQLSNDNDGDGVDDVSDNCPAVANAGQEDLDNDGVGDVCDLDKDGDTHDNDLEVSCGSDPADDQSVPDSTCLGTDTDSDGVINADDAFPNHFTEFEDSDGDGIGDNAEMDDDNDGVPDDADFYPKDSTQWDDGVTSLRAGTTNPEDLAVTVEPGPTPYTAGVDSDGLARVDIPLSVVSGVNGLAPSLSISYDSGRMGHQEENNLTQGVLGYGWTLEGISQIHRCEAPIDPPVDVSFTNSDRLCLDGELLVPIVGNTFDANAEYRTERDTFAKITADGDGFEVRTHDGRILKYGKTTDSRVEAGNTNVNYIWAINEEKDRFNNVMSYSYHADQDTGEIYPSEINYTAAKIKFEYADREGRATTRTEIGTGFAKSAVYLHKIAVSMNGTLVREYRLNSDLVTNRRRLSWLQLCGYDTNGSNEACLKELNFDWTQGETHLAVSKVTDSLGAETTFTYEIPTVTSHNLPSLAIETTIPTFQVQAASCSQSSPYFNGDTFHYPRRAYVKEMTTYNGIGTNVNRWQYFAADEPEFMWDNRGYAGHDTVIARDFSDATPVTAYTKRELCFPYAGLTAARYEYDGSSTSSPLLSRVENDWAEISLHSGGTKFVYPLASIAINNEGASQFGVLETTTSYASFTNVPSQVTRVEKTAVSATGAGSWWTLNTVLKTLTTTIGFQNDQTNWLNGFVTSVNTNHSDGTTSKVQNTTFVSEPGTMSLGSMTEPRGAAGSLTTAISYDVNGNPTQVTQSGTNLTARSTTLSGYVSSRYPGTITNPEGEVVTQTYDDRFGAVKTQITPDGRSSQIDRDQFGRVVRTEDTTPGNNHVVDVNFEAATDTVYGHNRAYRAVITDSAAPDVALYFDQFGRQISQARAGFNANEWVVEDVGYDYLGRIVSQSVPYKQTGLPYGASSHATKHTMAYDRKNRLTSRTNADGGSATLSYSVVGNELKVTTTEKVYSQAVLQDTITTYQHLNALGQLTKTTDANATDTTFTYDPMGNVTQSQVGSHPATTVAYDDVGQRTSITEPHTGTTAFEYTALGQLEKQTNAASRIIRFQYDDVGRLIQRFDDDQSSPTVNTWTYGTSGAATGRLLEGKQDLPGGATDEFKRTYTYDALSRRLTGVTTTVNNQYVTNEMIQVSYTYDDQGRVEDTTYDDVTIRTHYNGQDHLSQVSKDNKVLEAIDDKDAFDNVTSTTFGNELTTVRTFDPTSGRMQSILTDHGVIQDLTYVWRTDGSLKSRAQGNVTETFTYDSLKRLTSATTNNATARTLSYGYDALGNMLSKTSNVQTDTNLTGYTYGASKPNAVTNVTIGSDSMALNYDAVGNVTSITSPTADDRTFSYNAHNLVTSIDVNAGSVASEEFAYAPDNRRYFRKSMWDNDGSMETSYTVYAADGKIERVVPAGGGSNVTKIHLTRNVIYKKETGKTFFMHRDQIGSLHKMTNELGEVVVAYGFDPFGGRSVFDRTAELSDDQLVALLEWLATVTFRGFTGHEPLDRTGVVHMNGRIYDPVLSRFLNADPVVQAPLSSQSHNRYSYVLNNPLSYWDPSGFTTCVANGDPVLPAASDGVADAPAVYNEGQITCFPDGPSPVPLGPPDLSPLDKERITDNVFEFTSWAAESFQALLVAEADRANRTSVKNRIGNAQESCQVPLRCSRGVQSPVQQVEIVEGNWIRAGEVIGEGNRGVFRLGHKIKLEGADDRASLHLNNAAYELNVIEIGGDGKPVAGVYPIFEGVLSSGAANSLSTTRVVELYGPPGTKFDWSLLIKHVPKSCDNCGSPMIIIYDWRDQ